MGKARAGRAQRTVLILEPKRGVLTIGYAILAALAIAGIVALLIHPLKDWKDGTFGSANMAQLERANWIAIAVASAIAVLCILGAILNGRRWLITRWVVKMSEDPGMGLLPSPQIPRRLPAPMIPPLDVRILKTGRLPKPRQRFRRVTLEGNVVGHRPLEIAYLRLFENQPRIRTFVEGAWREFGYTYLLRSAASVTPAEYRWAKRSGDPAALFIRSPEQLSATLRRQRIEPYRRGRYTFKSIGPRWIRVRDRYGSYPMRPLLCHGAFWKDAVEAVLDRVDLVALDLSGLTESNAGTLYELQRVIDRFPIERVMFLADQRSKKRFITDQIQYAWRHMHEGSPNAVTTPKVAIVAITDYIARRTSSQGQGQTSQVQVKLVARRRQTRRVAATAQDRVDGIMG